MVCHDAAIAREAATVRAAAEAPARCACAKSRGGALAWSLKTPPAPEDVFTASRTSASMLRMCEKPWGRPGMEQRASFALVGLTTLNKLQAVPWLLEFRIFHHARECPGMELEDAASACGRRGGP